MRCKRLERSIALYVEGDLPARQARRVETHLARCAECRAFAEEVRQTLRAVRNATHSESDNTDLEGVRQSVLAAIEADTLGPADPGGRWRRLTTAAVVVAAAAVCGAVLVLYAHPHPRPESAATGTPAGLSVTAPTAAPEERTLEVVQQPVVGPPPWPGTVSGGVAHTAQAEPRTETIMIRMLTDNPDVIIIWLADVKEENHEEPKA